jgi:hypothetical protein
MQINKPLGQISVPPPPLPPVCRDSEVQQTVKLGMYAGMSPLERVGLPGGWSIISANSPTDKEGEKGYAGKDISRNNRRV